MFNKNVFFSLTFEELDTILGIQTSKICYRVTMITCATCHYEMESCHCRFYMTTVSLQTIVFQVGPKLEINFHLTQSVVNMTNCYVFANICTL